MQTVHEARQQQLSDRAEIGDVQLRYATGVDTRNWELLRSCFTDEIDVDFGDGFDLPAERLEAGQWIENTKLAMSRVHATQHVITNYVITFEDSDRATCVTYLQARHHYPDGDAISDHAVYGYYSNGFERTSTGWRINSMKLTVSWMTGASPFE